MADQIKKLSAGHSIEVLDAIMTEVEEARGEYDNLGERLDEMSSDTPTPSTAAPAMDGTAAAGTSTDYARADHIHPSDTSKQDALTAAQLDAVNSGINSTKVEQIETNKNNILLYQPDLKRATSFSGTTTYSMVSDCTIEIPSGNEATVYRISAMLGQGSAGIRGIILSKTNDSSTFDADENVLCKAEQATGLRTALSCSDIWFNASDNPRYVYCWVKLAVSGTGRVYTISERLG